MQCGLCSILCGWGGAGAYSDGKLTLTPEFGGWLKDYLSADELSSFIDYVDAVYLSFGAGGVVHGEDNAALSRLKKKAAGYNLELIPARIRHIGTDLCKEVLSKIREHLDGKIDVLFDTPVEQITTRQRDRNRRHDRGRQDVHAQHMSLPRPAGKGRPGFPRRQSVSGCRSRRTPWTSGCGSNFPRPS